MENWNLCFSVNRSVLQGYPEALERQAADLEKEVSEAEKNEDSDHVEYLINYDLERFSQDVTRAKQGGVINDTTAANYYKLHSRYIQRLKPLK